MPRILFLEDNVSWARNYIESLEAAGFEVVHLLDAEQAIQVVRAQSVDAMVVDIQLPIPSGVQPHEVDEGNIAGIWFLGQVREMMQAARIPAFVLSNNLTEPRREALTDLEKQAPALAKGLLQASTKIGCSARDLPRKVKAMLLLFGNDQGFSSNG